MTSGSKRKYHIRFFILWVVQMAAAFYFCTQKQGFHEDEFYTYYSTARTNGFYVENGKWMERETYRNEFVVLPNERFQYGLVKEVQSWDVHPPMYYWVFHTVASLVPGVFSKWIGLSVNFFFHGINLCLLAWLTHLVSEKDWTITLLVNLVYGFSPAAMSGVVFIRMYEMLTTFVLLCAILHVRVVREDGERQAAQICGAGNGSGGAACAKGDGVGLLRAKQENSDAHGQSVRLPIVTLLLMAIVTYLGFLTQYYYFIFLFFLAGAFCLWLLWRERKIWNCLRYGLAQGIAFGLAYLTYPSFPGQMFRGQRGAQATQNFFDLSNTFERLGFFLDLLNGYVFGYFFFIILIVMAALAVRVWRQRAQNPPRFGMAFWMLFFTAAGYFIAVSKTALLLGNTSNRYQLPIYGIVVLLVVYACNILWRQAISLAGVRRVAKEEEKPGLLYRLCPAAFKVLLLVFELIGDLIGWFAGFLIRHRKVTEKAAIVFCLVMVASGYLFAEVVFLYPEARGAVALAREQAAADIPVVYVYRPGEEWCIWAVADELMEYDRVYFVSAENEEPLGESAIADADAVVIYLPYYDDVKDEEAQSMRLPAGNFKLTEGHLQYRHKYCSEWYYCGDGAAWNSAVNP